MYAQDIAEIIARVQIIGEDQDETSLLVVDDFVNQLADYFVARWEATHEDAFWTYSHNPHRVAKKDCGYLECRTQFDREGWIAKAKGG